MTDPTAHKTKGDELSARTAAHAVTLLGLERMFDADDDPVFSQLEDCDAFASSFPDPDSMFIALSLPIVNVMIHYATSKYHMADAKAWLRETWPDLANEQDPGATLAALTLIHVINEGWKRYQNNPDKRDVWARIRRRVEKLSPKSGSLVPA